MTPRKDKTLLNRCTWVCANQLIALVLIGLFAGFGDPLAHTLRASSAPKSFLAQPLTLRWRYASGATLNLTPAADHQRIYLPLASGVIVSLSANDGQLYWKSEVGGEVSAAPVADERALYVASETTATAGERQPAKGALRALGREAGVTTWMKTLPMPIRGALAISSTKIFAGASDGGFYSFEKSTGNVNWFVQIGSALNCTPVVTERNAHDGSQAGTIFVGSEDGTLFALEESTGKMRWRYHTRGPVRGPVAALNDTVYFGSGDGYVYAVNEADGHLRWRTRTGAGVQAVKTVVVGVLVASFDNFVYLLSFNRGKRLWKRQLPGRISSQPATTDDGALFTPLAGDAGVVLGLRDGKPVNSLPTGEASNTAASPIIVADTVFITTDQGLLAFARP